jgi:hypothetical protein
VLIDPCGSANFRLAPKAAAPQLTRMGWTGRAPAPNRSEDERGLRSTRSTSLCPIRQPLQSLTRNGASLPPLRRSQLYLRSVATPLLLGWSPISAARAAISRARVLNRPCGDQTIGSGMRLVPQGTTIGVLINPNNPPSVTEGRILPEVRILRSRLGRVARDIRRKIAGRLYCHAP